jgi:hypothetical protein
MGVVVGFVIIVGIPCMIVARFARRRRERAQSAPVRHETGARVSFRTPLDRASVLGTGGFGGTRGVWIAVRGAKWLTVGTDSFVVSAPLALRQFAFTGQESTIALSQAPSGVVHRDWIVISGQAGGRPVRLAITRDNLPEVWQALAAAGAAPAPAGDLLEPAGTFGSVLSRVTGWRRVAAMAAFVVLVAFLPALVDLITRQLR